MLLANSLLKESAGCWTYFYVLTKSKNRSIKLSKFSHKTAPLGSHTIIYTYKWKSNIYFDARFPIVTRSGVARNIEE